MSLQINAMANRAAGKGYENESFYTNIKFQFLGIENIHVMRSSLQKLIEGKGLWDNAVISVLNQAKNSESIIDEGFDSIIDFKMIFKP